MTINEAVTTGNDINSSEKLSPLSQSSSSPLLPSLSLHMLLSLSNNPKRLKDSYEESFQFSPKLVHHFPATSLGASIAPLPHAHPQDLPRPILSDLWGTKRRFGHVPKKVTCSMF